MATCYGVQACSAHCKKSQWTWNEVLGLGRDFIQELADWEDGRLSPQINHLLGTWMLDLLWIRDGGRWGNKEKRSFNSCKYLLEWQASDRGCVSLTFYSHFMGGVKCNISCRINKQRCHIYLWFWPPQMRRPQVLSHLPYKEFKNVTVLHRGRVRLTPRGRPLCMPTNWQDKG